MVLYPLYHILSFYVKMCFCILICYHNYSYIVYNVGNSYPSSLPTNPPPVLRTGRPSPCLPGPSHGAKMAAAAGGGSCPGPGSARGRFPGRPRGSGGGGGRGGRGSGAERVRVALRRGGGTAGPGGAEPGEDTALLRLLGLRRGLRRLRRLWAGPRVQRGRGRGRGWGPNRGCVPEEESSDGESDDEVRQSEASPAPGGAEAGGFQGSGWSRGMTWGSGVFRAPAEGKGPGNSLGKR